tara:strand:+ start:350 stop:604 length:255 start_codon:yes stop_codon:yes gene_type:complete
MITLKEHHIRKAAKLQAVQYDQLIEGEQDMNTEQMINFHMDRAVELRAQEIVEARDGEVPKWYHFVAGLVTGLVVGRVIVALLL